MFDKGLTVGRFLKFCIAEACPIIIMAIIVAMFIKLIETISVLLAVIVGVVGTFFVCYLTLKWIEYSFNNKKIQNWIER